MRCCEVKPFDLKLREYAPSFRRLVGSNSKSGSGPSVDGKRIDNRVERRSQFNVARILLRQSGMGRARDFTSMECALPVAPYCLPFQR